MKNNEHVLEMTGASGAPGIALGRAYHYDHPNIRVPHHKLAPSEIDQEIARLNSALFLSQHQLVEASGKLQLDEHKQIIEAHLSLFQDPEFFHRLRQRIQDLSINAEWAVTQIIAEVTNLFDHVEDPYLRERRRDFEYVERRLVMNLMGVSSSGLEGITDPVVLVAHDLSPADLAQINRAKILGIVTDLGGTTSHTAILARALTIPTVVGLDAVTAEVKTGDLIIVDGFEGKVYLRPSMELITDFDTRRRQHKRFEEDLRKIRDLPAQTADHVPVVLAANIELPSELEIMRTNGVERIGLFRTEFLFLFSANLPDEMAQYDVYRGVIEKLGARGVTTIRTIDLGGDKVSFAAADCQNEANPAMGLRAIRLCLAHPDVFHTQLRAILRASAHGKTRIMFPMISGMDELRQAKALLAKAKDELRREGIPFDENIEIGIMIETPAAVWIADLLAKEVNFFSIGTNDLIQYTLAVDRSNEHVNYLFHPLHPSILRAILQVVIAGHNADIPVAMCGEMAGQPEYVMALLGLGLDELSMTPSKALHVKRLLSRFTTDQARALATSALQLATAGEVDQFIVSFMHREFPDEFNPEAKHNSWN